MVRAGIYVRISLDVQGQGLGVQRQEQACGDLAASRGWSVAEVYSDNDVSASSGKPRPAYQRLLADLESGKIDAVVVYAWDRLARRMADLVAFIDAQKRVGFEVAQVTGDVDLSSAAGRQTAYILGSVAQGEAERLGERVAAQKVQRASLGIPHKGRYRVFGYDDDWNVIESEAAIIREAFQRRANGESCTSIAKDFTARGIKTATKVVKKAGPNQGKVIGGSDWKSGTLSMTLSKDIYAGWITHEGQRVAKSKVPAIIDDSLFQAAQKNLANDSKGANTRKYLLSGILKCQHCLSPMKGNPSNHMYRCSTTYGGCGRLSIRIALADRWVVYAAQQKAVESRSKPDTGPVRDYDAEIAEAQSKRREVQDAFEAGIYSMKEAGTKIKVIDDNIKTLVKEQAKDRTKRNRHHTDRFLDFYKMNLSQKRAFISEHIEGVVVGPALSKGHQPFNPRRMVAHYVDGTVTPIEPDANEEQENPSEATEAP